MRFIWYRGRKVSKKSRFIDVYGDFIRKVFNALKLPLLSICMAIIYIVFRLILPYVVKVLYFIFYPISLVLNWIGWVLGITLDLNVENYILFATSFWLVILDIGILILLNYSIDEILEFLFCGS